MPAVLPHHETNPRACQTTVAFLGKHIVICWVEVLLAVECCVPQFLNYQCNRKKYKCFFVIQSGLRICSNEGSGRFLHICPCSDQTNLIWECVILNYGKCTPIALAYIWQRAEAVRLEVNLKMVPKKLLKSISTYIFMGDRTCSLALL